MKPIGEITAALLDKAWRSRKCGERTQAVADAVADRSPIVRDIHPLEFSPAHPVGTSDEIARDGEVPQLQARKRPTHGPKSKPLANKTA